MSKEFFKVELNENNSEEGDKKEDSKKNEIEGEIFKDKIEMVKSLKKNLENSEAVMRCSDKTSWSIAKGEIAKNILDEAKKKQKKEENEGFLSNQGEIKDYIKEDKKSEKKSETEQI